MTQPTSSLAAPPLAAAPLTRRLLPLGMLLLLGTMWGLAFSLAKLGRVGGVPPLAHTFWQATGAGVILLCICLARGTRPRLGRRFVIYYLFAGILGFAAPNANMVFALYFVPAGVMAVLITLVPVLTYMMAIAIGMERFAALRALGVGCGLAGALLILLPGASLPSPEMAGYALVALITPLLYAFGNIGMALWRPKGPGGDSLSLACGMTLTGGAGALIAMLAAGQVYLPGADGWLLRDWAVLGQIFITAIAFVIFFELLRMVGPVVTGVVAFVITCAGILWGMAIFGESHSAWVWGAVVLVLIGLALVNWTPRGKDRSRAAALPAPPPRDTAAIASKEPPL